MAEDLILRVGASPTSYHVHSGALTNVSTVFAELLAGPFAKPDDNNQQWYCTLPEDDPRAMSHIVDLLQGRQAALFRPISADVLFQVCAALDKYRMYTLLSLMKPWYTALGPVCESSPVAELGWIMWVFGGDHGFTTAARSLMEDAEADNGFPRFNWNHQPIKLLASTGLIAEIGKCRLSVIKDLLKAVTQAMRRYKCLQRPARIQEERNPCVRFVKDSLKDALCTSLGAADNLDNPAAHTVSIRALAEIIERLFDIDPYHHGTHDARTGRVSRIHQQCLEHARGELKEAADAIMRAIPNPISQYMLGELAKHTTERERKD